MNNSDFTIKDRNNTLALLRTIPKGREKSFFKIARYILDSTEYILNLNISSSAKKTGVSTATLLRFSVYPGFKNYRSFQLVV